MLCKCSGKYSDIYFILKITFWGDVCTHAREKSLLFWVESLDLTVLDTGEPTHFHIQTGSFSCTDLSVSSPNAFVDFNWKVHDLHGSDHFPILLTTLDAIPVTTTSMVH